MKNIVVLTFHTIFDHKENRPWSFLSDSVKSFENTLKKLKKKGYESISLQELYDLKINKTNDNKKRVIINFDDGFLDNYTIAYPLLKKYGMKATVYISPDFVDKREIVRPLTYEKLMRGEEISLEENWGYMSWDELRIIDQSGVIDVQNHAYTHTWYYSSPTLKDVHYHNSPYYWLWWNKYPERKPEWLTKYNEKEIEYGFPVFEYSKSLSSHVFIPYNQVVDYIIQKYNETTITTKDERMKFIEDIRNELSEKYGELGRFETNEEFLKRIEYELMESKRICEEKLGKIMNFLAWPGGAVSDEAKTVAQKAGFLAYTSKEKHYNDTLNDPTYLIYRLGGWSGVKFFGKISPLFESLFLNMQLHRAKGSKSLINRLYDAIGNVYRNKHIRKNKRNGENWK